MRLLGFAIPVLLAVVVSPAVASSDAGYAGSCVSLYDYDTPIYHKALDLLGKVDPATRQPYVGRLENAPTTYGKVTGFTTRVDGVFKRFRMDYDPVKGPTSMSRSGGEWEPSRGRYLGVVLRTTLRGYWGETHERRGRVWHSAGFLAGVDGATGAD